MFDIGRLKRVEFNAIDERGTGSCGQEFAHRLCPDHLVLCAVDYLPGRAEGGADGYFAKGNRRRKRF
jgi:hypothetical protein